MIKVLFAIALTLLTPPVASAEVQTKTVTYTHGSVELEGFLAWDDSLKGKRPGILVVHEWWGLNDYARQRAQQLAAMGYVAFALDMYGKGKVTQHPDQDLGPLDKALDGPVAGVRALFVNLVGGSQCRGDGQRDHDDHVRVDHILQHHFRGFGPVRHEGDASLDDQRRNELR